MSNTYTFTNAIDAIYSRLRETDSALLPKTNVKRYVNDAHKQIVNEKYLPYMEGRISFNTIPDIQLSENIYPSMNAFTVTDITNLPLEGNMIVNHDIFSYTDKSEVGVIKDSYTTIAGTTLDTYGDTQLSVKFTSANTYELTSIDLYMLRTGTPGTSYIDLYRVGNDGNPLDSALATGTFDGNDVDTSVEWYNVELNKGIQIVSGEQYMIVLRAPDGTVTTDILSWHYNTATVSGFSSGTSLDVGVTWTFNTGRINLYKTYGTTESTAGILQDVTGIDSNHTSGDKVRFMYSFSDNIGISNFGKAIYLEIDNQPIEYYDGRGQLREDKYAILGDYLLLPRTAESKTATFTYQKVATELTEDADIFLIPDDYITCVVEFAIYKAKLDLGYDDANNNFMEYQRIKRRMKSYYAKQTFSTGQRIKSVYQDGFDSPQLKFTDTLLSTR